MLYLKLRKGRTRNGETRRSVVPIVRRKTRKYGQVLDERALSVKKDWLVTGANASGKSRWLGRLYGEAPGIWKQRPTIYLRAVAPLSAWGEDERVKTWCEKAGHAWSKLRVWERVEKLVAWIEEHRAVVLLDDAHLMTGRKADIALRCVRVAGLVVTSASAEGRIPITLRLALQGREPERVHLDSDAPYDITPVLAWMLVVMAAAAGAWPLAAAIGGMTMLGRGARAAKQT
jgi:hypothetical protein